MYTSVMELYWTLSLQIFCSTQSYSNLVAMADARNVYSILRGRRIMQISGAFNQSKAYRHKHITVSSNESLAEGCWDEMDL